MGWKLTLADYGAAAFAAAASPVLRFIANHRAGLVRFQRFSDRAGFQLRSAHYYEPTYRESDLPADTTGERDLPGIDFRPAAQLELLGRCRFQDELSAIPVEKSGPAEYGYRNQMYEFGDAEMLYNMIRLHKPKRIYEIGSGNSTLMARLAIAANRRDEPAYECEHLCIEPYEMPWLEQSGVKVIRERVEQIDLTLFDRLEADDILFIDSSHVLRPRGDVLREYQEIVPRIAPNVLIHVHDIFTPRDYPEAWLRSERRLWNEQYLLEAFLAFNNEYEIVSALNWLKHNHFEAMAAACPMLALHPHAEPGAFWFRRTGRGGAA
jgi:hypothetical protein